jgi:hypothetical protein
VLALLAFVVSPGTAAAGPIREYEIPKEEISLGHEGGKVKPDGGHKTESKNTSEPHGSAPSSENSEVGTGPEATGEEADVESSQETPAAGHHPGPGNGPRKGAHHHPGDGAGAKAKEAIGPAVALSGHPVPVVLRSAGPSPAALDEEGSSPVLWVVLAVVVLGSLSIGAALYRGRRI